jgi:hypothetical protein
MTLTPAHIISNTAAQPLQVARFVAPMTGAVNAETNALAKEYVR